VNSIRRYLSALTPRVSLNAYFNCTARNTCVRSVIYSALYGVRSSNNHAVNHSPSKSHPVPVSSSLEAHKGATLIEVLISLLLLVVGILGALATQALSIKSTFDAKQRTLATHYAQDMMARMRANHPSALSLYQKVVNEDSLLKKPDKQCATLLSSCTPEELAEKDLYELQSNLIGSNRVGTRNNKIKLISAIACIEAKATDLNISDNKLLVTPSKKRGAYVQVSISIVWQNKSSLKNRAISSCNDKSINNQVVSISSTML
jgi:type IV pilus assembly protein PilV